MPRSRPQPIDGCLRGARAQAGLSQGEVSERTGLTQTTISRYETGAANPSEPTLRLLAAVYDKPYEWFFEEPGPPPPPQTKHPSRTRQDSMEELLALVREMHRAIVGEVTHD